MQGVLYEEPSGWLFLRVTCLMGGWAAWMTGRAVALTWGPYWHDGLYLRLRAGAGRAVALTWGPYWQCVLYLLLLARAVRFIHFALFNGTLHSLHYYLVDAFVIGVIGSIGYRFVRARQMTSQYRWLYERTGPLTWRKRR